jgi:tRNA A-37 threonylcarbamoyl transferase component Bud32
MSQSTPPASETNTWRPDSAFPALLDRYQILGTIGQGGMGTVFKGYHVSLKRFVAIKTLRIDKLQHPDLVNRFRRETHLAGQMDHPNVVRATDAGEKNGVFYLVMEYLNGVDLTRLVAHHGRLDPADACELIRQATVGLDYIHQTLVHRDIKPSNLLLTTAGVVKILDLGLARFTVVAEVGEGEHTPSGLAVGTYDYMAPEQAAGGAGAAVDGRADVYSLGCTLYKLLTGRAPFSGPDFSSVARKLYAHCHLPLTELEDFRSIPEAVQEVLLRMTAKDVAGRYSAQQAAGALVPLAAGSQPVRLLDSLGKFARPPVQPLPVPLPEELGRLTGDNRATLPGAGSRSVTIRLLLVGGVLACALAGLTWLLVVSLPRPRHDDHEPGREGEGREKSVAERPKKTASPTSAVVLRDLDSLAPRTSHRLLEQPPFLPGEAAEARKWRWEQGEQLLEVKGGMSTLALLGTTSRSRFTFEAGIEQTPWTGRVGILWGYREDAAVRQARKPGGEFAWFQMLIVWQTTDPRGEARYHVRRGKGTRRYNDFAEAQTSTHYSQKQDVPRLTGEKILVIVVDHNRLARALLGSADLPLLCADSFNKDYQGEPYHGGLGVITLGHSATFGTIRFLAQASK